MNNAEAKKTVFIIVTGFSFVLVFSGLVLLWNTISERFQGGYSSDWPYVIGTITESHLSNTSTRVGSGSVSSSISTRSIKPIIQYKYLVNGREYKNNKITFGGVGGSSERYGNKFINQFPLGSSIKVFYSPSNPAESVLIRGGTKNNDIAIFGAFCVFGFGLMMFIQRHKYVQSMPD